MPGEAADAGFEEFVQARSATLLRVCYLLTGDDGHAEDLLQTALANCYRHWRRATNQGREEGYVRTAILNEHISAMRRRRVREIFTGRLPEHGTAPAQAAVDDRDLLRRALAALAPRTRAAVVLRHYVGLTEPEAAEALGCSVGNVKRLTARGLGQLRAAMGRSPDGSADPAPLTVSACQEGDRGR